MDIREKLYPYPVLTNYSDDYIESKFETDVKIEIIGYEVILSFTSVLDNCELLNLIRDGKAKYAYHIECTQTSYRQVVLTDEATNIHHITDDKINGKISICPFIIAVDKIEEFFSDDFNDVYKGFTFMFEEGCIIGVGQQFNISIQKNREDLTKTPSIFSIVKYYGDKNNNSIDMFSNKIVIRIPETEFIRYQTLSKTEALIPVLSSMIILPALVYVIERLSNLNDEDKLEFMDYTWFNSLDSILKERFQIELLSEDLKDHSSFELSQNLIANPISDGLNRLWLGYSENGDEEDE
ncbi:hypothetical protein [Enterococcus sp. 5H]|uniref:hypothetical protein n=1 Tax=Enterococcus sp. 5H TaxID=1229490 RepID=UPI002303355F|nr:hypothetical protein [Enterococcus sp. 5H]MDA9471601.1 hypothetical protein [Enterococcus sp. 5H]